jgi:5-methylcytosine-specific restriction endonuclease McrA
MQNPFDDWPPAKRDDGKNWGEAKLTILKLLWPMEWVEGSEIFKEVQQTYYDRRIRELRESGWQIETHPSGKMYRLVSHEKLPGKKREYPTARQKRNVRKRDKNLCQICEQPDENMQFDHKIPLDRNGPTEEDNLQLLCRACNVEKRGACKRCKLETCDGCPYAYPELFEPRLVLFLDKKTSRKLKEESATYDVSETSLALRILSQYYEESEP